jgi:hypothetical protein
MRMLALTLAAFSLFAAGSVAAQGDDSPPSLRLASPANTPAKIIIDGAVWKCADGVCIASGGKSQSAERACRRVVAKLGAVSAFRWQGDALTDEAVAACNGAAS